MSKKLNITSITNELEESAFFSSKKRPSVSPAKPQVIEEPKPKELKKPIQAPKKETPKTDTMIPRYHDTVKPLHHDTMIPSTEDEMVETIRKAVKQVGKEPATQRLTLEEKRQLKTIEFAYGGQGIETSANEIIRIATNYIFQDYKQNGENSVLAKVLKKLNS